MSLSLTIIFFALILLILLFSGIRVAFALGIAGLIVLVFMVPGTKESERMLGILAWTTTNQFTLTALPLFILMGEFLVLSRMNETLYGVLSIWLGNIRSGLCHTTTLACAVFAAMSGSSLATCATLGTVAAPEMIKRGYSKRLTYGTIVAGGTLGILIPPSITMIIYGNLAGVSIAQCFIAGVIPGVLCIIMFMFIVTIWSRISPGSIPKATIAKIGFKKKLFKSLNILPTAIIILIVLGGIYLGIMTPTEAGAIGALCALILCLAQRKLNWGSLWGSLLSTVRITSFIMLIVVGASMVSFVVQYLRIAEALTDLLIQLKISKYVVIIVIYFLYLILGMLVDVVSMMVMTVPVILPSIIALGFDPIWFAVVLTLTCEIGLITPPVGLNLYIMRGITNEKLGEIALGALPFVVALFAVLAIVTAFPVVSLWLPRVID